MATTVTPGLPELVESKKVSAISFDKKLAHVLAAGKAQLDGELVRLRSLGIIDDHGNLLKAELPADMHAGAERDFGG